MKTTLAEKLDTLECRKDEKARRVLNVAPDTVADITAEELETGVTLERLDGLNVPVLRYSTQLTIHGKLPAFNPAARPGGYKAIFQNSNGSIGVRYSAIDGVKKAILCRCSRVAKADWRASMSSEGLQIARYFIVRDENQRAAIKAETLAALAAVPVSRFYGNVFACYLAYGAGYAVAADIGAIPQAELWPLAAFFFGIDNETQLAERERIAQAEIDAKHAQWEAENAKRDAEIAAERAKMLSDLTPIKSVPVNGVVFVLANPYLLTVELTRERGKDFYQIKARDGVAGYDARKLAKNGFPWPKALAAGRVYGNAETLAKLAETVKETASAQPSKDRNGPASPRQTFALFCATGKDWRNTPGLTYGKVSDALGAVQHLRGNKPAALAIVAKMFS